jgi:bacterioferritin-associated ferredoxin
MIICSCNVLSDHDVRSAMGAAAELRSPMQVHLCLGCRVQCGQCAGAIRRILSEMAHGVPPHGLQKHNAQGLMA